MPLTSCAHVMTSGRRKGSPCGHPAEGDPPRCGFHVRTLDPTGPLPSWWLHERYGTSATDLHRWTGYGWIEPEQHPGRRGSGSRLTWPRWVARVVALLMLPGEADRRRALGRLSAHEEHSHRMRSLAEGLIDHPDAPWFAWVDGAGMVAEYTAEDAVRVVMECEPGPFYTLVSPPPLDGLQV